MDLLLPLTAALPFERHVRWSARKQIPGKVAQQILVNSKSIVSALAVLGPVATLVSKGSSKLPGPIGKALAVGSGLLASGSLEKVADLAGEKLEQANAEAKAKNHRMTAVLTGFLLALEKGEEEQVLQRSSR